MSCVRPMGGASWTALYQLGVEMLMAVFRLVQHYKDNRLLHKHPVPTRQTQRHEYKSNFSFFFPSTDVIHEAWSGVTGMLITLLRVSPTPLSK